MKKSLLISASLLTLSVVTGIYAQTTTGASIVDKMKAVAHSFTLWSILNPTDTGLTSDPVKGKKTGDILTAGEWNRVLELVSEGGGSTNSENSYLQLTTPSSVTFVEGGKVPFTTVVSQKGSQITQNSGEITLKGGSSYRISSDLRLTSPNSGIWYTIVDKTTGTGVGVFGANYTGTYTGSWWWTSALALVSPTVDTTYFIKTSSLSWGPYSTSGAGHFTVEELGGSGGSSSTGNGEMVMSEMSPTTYANLIDAVNYCRNLTENGITNWKFPTYGDLVNFIDLKYPQDMVWVADFDVSVGASTYIIKDYFASMRLSDGYWSVSTLADGANKVRCVAQTGGIGGGNSGSWIASRAAALRAAGYTLPIPSTITDWPNQIICAGSGGAAGSGVVFDLFEAGISSVSYASQDGYGVWFNPTTGAISTVGRTDPKCGASLADIGTMCKEGRCVYGSNSAPTPSNLVYINPDNTNFTPLECKPGMNYMIDAISFNATSASAYTTMKLAVLKSGNWKAKGTGFVRNRNINSNSTQTFRFSSILDGVTTNLFENTADTGIYASSFSEDISVPAGKTTEINVSVRNNIVYGGTVTLWCTN